MSDDAPPRITSPSSHGSSLARSLVNAAKSDAPAPTAKAAARAKLEQFLASESQPKAKAPATDMPLFGASSVDVLVDAAQHTIPAHENKPTNSSSVEKAAPPASNGDFFSASAAPAATANSAAKPEQHPTGERHENSVLFSLAKLSGAPDNKASKPAVESKPKSESSVVDVKSMDSSKSAIDEILTVGAGGALSSPLAAPVLAQVAPSAVPANEAVKSSASANKTIVASVLGAATILVGGTLGALYILKTGQPRTQVGSEGSGPNAANAPSNGQNNGQNSQGNNGSAANTGPNGAQNAGSVANNGTNGANAAGPAGTTQQSGTAPSGNEPSNRAERSSRSSRSSSSSSSSSTPSNNSASSAPAGSSCAARCRGDIACLLSCGTQTRPANNSAPSSGSSSSAPAGGGPETPARSDVLNAMRGVQGAVRACAVSTGQTGLANISITFASSGRVTTASVAPPFAGTPVGSCMARAVRAATVPAFTRPTFSVSYPFSL
jgi:hypothetical protein